MKYPRMQAMNEHHPSRKPTFIMKESMHAYMQSARHRYFHVKTKLDKTKPPPPHIHAKRDQYLHARTQR